uniref:Uncharacterized protein n=1 Tax=Strongyloides stercoralis TaxID=6248 RepID=A0AAF5HXT5_STRER
MALRRQRQLERKYSSFRKYTSTEDINYRNRTSRSAYRSESVTSHTDRHGRSCSTEIITGSETRSFPVYVALQDYIPNESDIDSIPVEQGQIVEVLDSKNASKWLVRTKAKPQKTGWVPGSYFETPTQYYKQRKITRELTESNPSLSPEEEALQKRDQAYGDLLKVEEEFVQSLGNLIDDFIKIFDLPQVPEKVKEYKNELASCIKELYNFHAHVLLKGLEYYSDNPGKVGHTFLRLEKDFDYHVIFEKDYQNIKKLIEIPEIKEFLDSIANKTSAGVKTYEGYLDEIISIIQQYENFFKEFIKYSQRANHSTKSMGKALEIIKSISKKSQDLTILEKIENYTGDVKRLGEILRQDIFQVWEREEPIDDQNLFLFKNKIIMVTPIKDKNSFKHYATLRLDKYTIREHTIDINSLVIQPNESGLPFFRVKPIDNKNQDIIVQAWIKDINEMQEILATENGKSTETTDDTMNTYSTEYDATISDFKTDFTEMSGSKRSSVWNGYNDPDEGPSSAKKTKSPPVISPTASSASICSGFSGTSSFGTEWSQTGSNLEFISASGKICKTQYGFRSFLSQGGAKLCLKVTGYPLPEITWYKDDVLMHETDRIKFYSDAEGHFALCFEGILESDTGRYTCIAQNEFGSASTSAQFRVIKAEKEAAPPVFVTKLKDQECVEGDIVCLEAEVDGWPEPDIVWLMDDSPIQQSSDFKMLYDGRNASLEIRDAQPDDSGVYTLKIQNEYGTTQSDAILHVEADPDKNYVAPEFQSVIDDVEANEGDTVKFKAVMTGDPEPEIVWMINGIPLTESEKIKMIQEDGICILTIKDVTRFFDGKVTCQAKNRLGTSNCEAMLKIRIPPAAPNFEKHLESKLVQEKETITFECEVSGWEEPNVQFFLNGKELINNKDNIQIIKKDTYYKIIITECSIDLHDGELIGKAINQHGSAESRARITIEPPDESSKCAPTFLKDIEDQTVVEGEKAIFETTVKAHPLANVSWFINGNVVDSSHPGIQIEVCNCDHKITIDSAQYAGTVLCRAENNIGKYETKARLIVLPKVVPKRPPEIIEHLKEITEMETKTAIFEVRASGNPIFEWYRNEERIYENERIKIREFDGSSKLEIINLKLEESGSIKVIAKNDVGEVVSQSNLTVQQKPKAPEFIKTPEGDSSERGKEQKFYALATGYPSPTYTWFINGRKVIPTTVEARVETGEDKTSILIIDTTHMEDVLKIEVLAENVAGIAKFELTMEVKRYEQRMESKNESKIEEIHRAKVQEDFTKEETVSNVVKSNSSSTVLEERYHEEQITTTGLPTTGIAVIPAILVPVAVLGVGNTGNNNIVEEVETLETTTTTTTENATTTTTKKEMKITRTLSDQSITRGEWANFGTVIENASNVVWLFNNSILTPGPGVKISSTESYEYNLSMDTTDRSTGDITCRAETQTDDGKKIVEQTVRMTVDEKIEKPEISEGLKKVNVTEGESFTVDVVVSNKAQFVWTLNGVVMEDGSQGVHIKDNTTKSTFMVDEAKQIHSGEIKVTAQNEAGQAESKTDIVVEKKQTPARIEKGIESKEVNEGEQIEYTVKVQGFPEPNVKFIKNGNVIESGKDDIIIEKHDNEYKLKLLNVKKNDSGKIEVVAENKCGSDKSSGDLKVIPKPVKPIIKTPLYDKDVEEGTPIRYDIELEDYDKLTTLDWYLNDKKLESDGNINIVDHQDGSFHINIRSPTESMTGTLKCVAKNKAGECSSTGKLNVGKPKPPGSPPQFTKELQEKENTEGESVKFSTIVSGDLPITIKWYLNNSEVVSIDEKIKVKYEEDTGKTSIRIYKLSLDQTGEIKVKAENKYGEAIATTQLKVTKKLELPKFTNDMKSMQVVEGTPATFSCSVEGDPQPQCEWELNGKPIVEDDKVNVSQNGDTYSVTFLEPTLDMTGEVAMVAKNAAGVKKQIATLSVRELGCAPTFSEELKNILVNENETVLMTAKLGRCKPEPIVTFLKDGSPISSDDEHVKTSISDDGSIRVHILQAKASDQSRITIKAENSFGIGETSASIGVEKIRAQKKPEFMSDIPPQTIREGDSLTTKVIISGNPDPFVKWYINNQLVCKTEDTELTSNQGVYSMTIHGCSTDMTGTIKCVAYNKMGENFKEGQLTVIASIPVEFESCLCDATCREGDTLKLKAVLLGEPMPEVSWYVNGKKLEETQNIKIHQDGSTYTVTIKDITLDFTGEVICKATNEFGSAESKAMLLVLPRGDPPDFLEWLSNIKARENSTVIHKVIFTGDPKPTLTWYINNEEVHEDENISIVTNKDTSILTIKKFNPYKHSGEIICKAENEAGEVSCTATMAAYTSDMYSESESEAMADDAPTGDEGTDIQSDVEEEYRVPTPIMAPMFIKKMKDTRANKGQQAIFECVVPNTKGIVCKWLKDGKEVELIARIRVVSQVVEEGKLEQLIIDDCLPEDGGEYTCIIQNEKGVDKCVAKLEVIDTHVKPQFVSQLQDQECKWKESATFECTITGDLTSPCKWYKEEKIIESSEHYTITSYDTGLQKLIINTTKISDSGSYKCLIEDKTGNIETSAKLKVKTIPPTFTKELSSQTLSLHEKLVLQCSVTGLPQPMVEFYANGERIQTGNGVSVQHDANNIHWRVVINSVEKESFTTYIAEAKSEVGTATSKCEVKEKIVDEPPEFGKKLQNIKVKENETVEMSVSVKGKPEPTVKFQKDGKDIEIDNEHIFVRKESASSYSLVINEARLEDIGTYSCVAINNAGEAETSCSFGVEKVIDEDSLLAEPLFVEPLKSCQVNENETVELTCKINEESKPTIKWFKDNSPVQIGDHIIEEHLPDGSLKLKIINATKEDIGEYKCEAVNKKGKAITDSKLDVKHAEEKTISDDSNIPEPMFIEPLKPCQVNEDDNAELVCKVNEESKPEIHWFKDNTPVKTGEHITEEHLPDGSLKLKIQSAKVEDTGVYKCEAINQKGKAVTDSSLDVKYADEKSTDTESLLAEPLFVEPLKSCQVNENETIELTCKINEESKPTIKWFKDNSPVKVGDHIIEEHLPDGTLKLKIINATKEDIGEYKCEAVNVKGKAITDSKLDVKHAEEKAISDDSNIPEPMFIEPLKPCQVNEDDNAELICKVNEESKPEIYWFKDNTPVKTGEHITEEHLPDGSLKLKIQNAKVEDTGVYKCEAVNQKGKAVTDSSLDVKYADEKSTDTESLLAEPLFVEPLKSCQVNENETVELSCKVNEESKPTIKWFKDNSPVKVGDHITEEHLPDGSLKLKITNATIEDIGEYKCEAVNRKGKAITDSKLDVKHAEEKKTSEDFDLPEPMFIEPLQPQSVSPGDTIELCCQINEDSKATIQWLKDDKPIVITPNMKEEYLPNGVLKLTIQNATTEDVGVYQCVGVNKKGKATTDSKLELKYAKEQTIEEGINEEMVEEISGFPTGEEEKAKVADSRSPPEFIELIRSCTIEPGVDAVLTCKVKGEPRPEITWSKDGKKITESDHIKIEYIKDSIKLTIVNATLEDSGEYRCDASNALGNAWTEGPVLVTSDKIVDGEAPDFLQPIKPITVVEGQKAVLEGKLIGKPKPTVKWYKNGEVIKADNKRILIEDLPDGTQRLIINETLMSDNDEYRCEATNEYGDVWADATLKVTPKDTMCSFKKGLENQELKKGSNLVLEIEVDGKPKDVKFYKGNNEIDNLEDLGNGKYKLVIENVKDSDFGNYSVKVSNDAGIVESKAVITCKEVEKPVITKGLVPTTAKEGDEVKFTIEVKGNVDSIEWKQNGKSMGPGKDLGNGKYEFTIPSVKKDDAGDISVVLKNEGGTTDDSAKLTVKGEPITFKKGLQDKEAKKGDKVLLDIETSKKPKQVKFYKNGKEIPTKDLGNNKYGVEIPSVDKDDDASYTVKVTDDDDNEVESSCKLTVKIPAEKPVIVKGLVPTTAKEGDEVKFTIEVKGTVDSIEWKQNGKSMGPGKDLGNGKYEFTIPSVKKEDAGDISVVLKNEGGATDDSTKLTVKGEPITIKKGLQDKEAKKGDKVLLDIETSKKPKQVRFYKNGKEVPSKDLGNNKFGVEIPSVDKDDDASYTVKVTDDDDNEADSSCKLTVKLPAEKPVIVKGLVPTIAKEGDEVKFTIEVKGNVDSIEWKQNGKSMGPGKDLGNGKYEFTIPSVKKEDAGDISVVLKNEGGSADDSTKLTVKGEPITIKKGLQDKEAKKGDKVLLDIETSKKPKQVRFYKNGKEVPSKDLGNNKFGIEIPSAGKDDEASYTVKVTDDDGNEADSSCKLTVKLPAEKPIIVKGLVPITAKEGDEVKFTIEVKGSVDSIEWKQNGKSMGPGKDLGNGKYEFTIPSVKKDDAGDISVVLKNEGGSADDSTKLTVKGEPITIKKGLQDKEAKKGDKVLLDIETSKKPKQVRFYKNGKEVPSKDLGNNKFGIEIPSADKDDEASYTVKVKDDDGNEADSSCKLTVKLPAEPIKIIKGLDDLFIPEGKPINLDVKITGKPKQVKWYKNGKESNENSKIVNENTFVYEIPSAHIDDSGVYEVEFANEEMTIKTKGNVTVEREPKFTKGLEDKTVKEGEEVIFEAETTEKVRIVKWYKNGKEIRESKRINFISIENSYKLIIKDSEMDDLGSYKIVLENSAGKIESEAKLTVLSGSDVEPRIVKGLVPATIDAGDEHSFRVEVSAPVRVVKWYRNGEEIKECSGIELRKLNPKKYELLIKSALSEDVGNYKVVLSNDAGECDSSADLDVKVPEIVKLIDGLKDQDVNEGEPLQLKAKISGKPRQVKWYKNGQEITPNDNLKLSDSDGEYTLTIPQSKSDDGGVYRVVFTHDKGEIPSSCSVYVKPKKKDFVGTSPDFLGPLSDVTIPEGETLILKCQVSGNPMPDLRWFKDGVEVHKSDRVTLRLSLDGTASLRILDSKKDDTGKYSIIAKNDFGEKESSCNASVLDESEIPGPPKFIIPLKTTDGKVGQKVEFSVKVRGFPKPEVKFILNNNQVIDDDNYMVEDLGNGHWMFTIKSITPDDFGSIRAIAKNEFGQVECNASFCESLSRTFKPRDEEGYEPRWNVPLWDRRLPLGHPASIECHVDAKPRAEITWLFEDKIITKDMKEIEFVNTPDGCCKLKVLHLTPEWVGMYKCIAKNSYGVADTRANLNIEEEYIEEIEYKREYPPRFNPQLEDVILEIGKTITLNTIVDAIPMASITWYKDGLPIKLTSNMSTDFDEETGSCTLKLKDVTEADTGAYRCIATNIHGTTNTACLVGIKTPKIEIIKEGEEPFFTKGLTDKWVDRGGELFITCTVTGSPFPQIKFYRNGVLLRSNNKVKIEILPDGVCNLTVSDCTLSDEGIYRCEAENKYGKAKTQSTIHVEVNLKNLDRSIKEDGEAPRFIIPLEDNTVLLNNTIELNCKVTGKPMPLVKWSKDGVPLFDDKRFEWDNNPSNGTYSLRIENCKSSDEGTYRCIATNDEGSASTKAFIQIDDGGYLSKKSITSDKGQPPRIILNIGDVRANEGSPLKLVCKIEASPLPELVWYRNGEKVIPNDNYQTSLEPDGTGILYIPKCTMDDDGIYRVIATNIHGTVQSRGNATVKRLSGTSNGLSASPYRSPSSSYDTGKAPKVIIPLDNIKTTDKQSFKLRCKFSGERIQIKWYKDGERLYSFGRTQVFENIDGNTELEVISASRFDAGCYRCVAENEYGSARTTCDVIIETKGRKLSRDYISDLSSGNAPGFITPLTIKRVKVGDDVTFECLPYGKPFPDIKWLKDGLELSNSSDIIIESEVEGKQRLTIKSVKFESEGYYRCVATNNYGTASTKAELIVTDH